MSYSASTLPLSPSYSTKRVTPAKRNSATADGSFVAGLRDLGHFGSWRRGKALVGVFKTPLSLPLCHPDRPLTPRSWGYIGDDVKALHYHEALRLKADYAGLTFRAFTLRLSRKVEADARARHAQCLDYLHRRVALHLKRALQPRQGEYRSWWFAIEEDRKGALHLHGEIAFRFGDRKLVRKSLCAAAGKWIVPAGMSQGQSPRQLRFSPGVPNYGWVGYATKRTRQAGLGWRRLMRRYGSPRRWSVSFEGKAVTATREVKAAAKVIHNRAVADVKRLRKPSKAMLIAKSIH